MAEVTYAAPSRRWRISTASTCNRTTADSARSFAALMFGRPHCTASPIAPFALHHFSPRRAFRPCKTFGSDYASTNSTRHASYSAAKFSADDALRSSAIIRANQIGKYRFINFLLVGKNELLIGK
ncbi:hypothetical protein [Paraburkholderia humisilvae]|uniref:hypothetical protein n=1 Tax=Paraburkholderia humisilvae TaxID=627669 RepID=UPI001583A7CE